MSTLDTRCERCGRVSQLPADLVLEDGWDSIEEAQEALGDTWVCPRCRTREEQANEVARHAGVLAFFEKFDLADAASLLPAAAAAADVHEEVLVLERAYLGTDA